MKLQPKRIFSNYLNLLLLASVLFTITTRIYGLDHRELWGDEIFSVNHSDPSRSLSELKGEVTNPPLYQIVLWGWTNLFGQSIWAVRSLSVLVGVLSMVAIYFLAMELFNRRVAVYTVFVNSVTCMHITMSQETRSYAMFFLFSIVSLYLLSMLIKREKVNKKIYLFYVLSNVCMINTHYYAYPLIFVQGVFLIFFHFFTGLVAKRFYVLLLCLSFAILGSVFHLHQLIQAGSISKFWIEEKIWYEKLIFFKTFFAAAYQRDWLIATFWLLFLWACFSSFLARYKTKSYTVSFQLISCWMILGFAIPIAYSFLKLDILITRYFVGVLPAMQVAIAVGLARIPNKISGTVACIIFLLIAEFLATSDFYATTHLW